MLPRSMQAQLEEADRIVAVIEGEIAQPNTPDPQPIPDPQPTPVPVVTQQQSQPVVVEQPEETWQQKYRTLKGMFDAQKGRDDQALGQLGQQVHTLIQDNATLKAHLEQRQAEQPKVVTKRLTDADRETFGAELVDMVERAATPAVDQTLVESALKRIADLEGAIGNVKKDTTQTREALFYSDLTKAVPDWQAVNVSDAWKAWLMEVDSVYGIRRQAGLDVAFENLDATRVAKIFETFTGVQPVANPEPTPQQELQHQVTPTRSHGAPEPMNSGQQQGMIWTDASIRAFSADLRRGLIPKEQAAAYEEDLNRAAAEGRIRP